MNLRQIFASFVVCTFAALAHADDNWPQFRGRAGLGIGSGNPPTQWNVETQENIAWKVAIPGLGHSAPVVWGDRVFLTTAVSADAKDASVSTGWSGGTGESAGDSGDWTWKVLCLKLDTGVVLWSKDVRSAEPTIKRHLKATHANCTPATNGKYVVAFFGSEGLHCFDSDGNLVWQRDFGKLHSGPYNAKELEWGFASSPVIHDGRVIIQCDCLNTSFVAILDLENGKDILRIDREGEVATWSTPLVAQTDSGMQIVCNGFHQMAGYDFETGDQLWHLSNGGDVPVPTPLFSDGLIYLTNGHGRSPTYVVSPAARGDLTPSSNEPDGDGDDGSGLVWWQPRDGSYMPTPLILDELLYTCNDNGKLTVRNAKTGAMVYRKRVGKEGGTYSASAVTAGGIIYFANEAGEVTVVQKGENFERLASNQMDEIVMATPAISGDRLLIRTIRHLYCIAPK